MNPSAILTKTELEVAELLAWGASKRDIAKRRFRSIRTVENTARNIYQKTEVTKSSELSAWYFCKTYNISFSLSPLARSLTSIALLFLLVTFEYSGNTIIRTRTSRSSRTRTSRKADDDLTFDYQ